MSGEALWLDLPEAESLLNEKAASDPLLFQIGQSLIDTGFAVAPGLIDPQLCDAAAQDFQDFSTRAGDDPRYRDAHGNFLRVVNLHLSSANALRIGLDSTVMKILDFIFGCKAGIYSSLYFEHGTQQPIHRDSPFFETFPRNFFMGVWVALEDIHPDAGPLMYVPGAHRFECDPKEIFARIQANHPDKNSDEVLAQSLQIYYGEVAQRSSAIAAPVRRPLKKGDVAFWHPLAPHGGSPATNPALTRRSMVFHCTPETRQVYQHGVFFSHQDSNPPPPRYGYSDYDERKVALSGETCFQLR